MFCDRTHSSMCQTSIDSNLGVLLRADTDEKVPDKLVNTIRARKVPNNVTDVLEYPFQILKSIQGALEF
jgi:hypothetical protein